MPMNIPRPPAAGARSVRARLLVCAALALTGAASCGDDSAVLCEATGITECRGGELYERDSCGEWYNLSEPCGDVPNCAGRECGPDGAGGSCGACSGGTECNSVGVCIPVGDCDGRECGPDGAGGSCGSCPGNQQCTAQGRCEAVPDCAGRECGDDGAGGSCGSCPSGQQCNMRGSCDPVGDCRNRDCGPDGAGGSCGSCPGNQQCSDQGACEPIPDCTGRECGPDGAGGSCGSCRSNEQCTTRGICEPVPDCTGRECGPDGAGGSCGSCRLDETCSPAGQCLECDDGDTRCVASDVSQHEVCVNGRWQQTSCPQWQLCTLDQCRTVCDGLLATTPHPTICYMPHGPSNGVLWYSNDTARLGPNHTQVSVVNNRTPARIFNDSSQRWPHYWSLEGTAGAACIGFRLNQFGALNPPARVTYLGRVKRAGLIGNLTRWLVAFFDPNANQIGTANGTMSYLFENEIVFMDPPLTSRLFTNGRYNSGCMGVTGDGFGNLPDFANLNFMLLEIQP